jgi:hypothetical protein
MKVNGRLFHNQQRNGRSLLLQKLLSFSHYLAEVSVFMDLKQSL